MPVIRRSIILAQQKRCSREKRNSKASIQKHGWGRDRSLRYDTDFVLRAQSLKFSQPYTIPSPSYHLIVLVFPPYAQFDLSLRRTAVFN